MAFQYGRQDQWVNSSFPNLELNVFTDLLCLITLCDSNGLRRAHTGFACCVFNNNHDQQINQNNITAKKHHLNVT